MATRQNIKSPPNGYDYQLLLPVLFLVGIGLVMVYSASSAVALTKLGSGYYFVKKQALYAFIGLLGLILFRYVPYKVLYYSAYPSLLVAVVLLCAVHISGIGHSAGGASRWIKIGEMTFQPSEFARIAMVIYLAYSLKRKQEKCHLFSVGFAPHVIILLGISILILSQPDFGSVVILSILTWIMMFAGGVRIIHLGAALIPILPIGLYVMIKEDYRLKRIMTFMDPFKDAANEGYQISHSFMAFGTGGIWGTGVGQGYQKLFYLPEPHTDFIFSVIGEELGLIGVLFIISLYFWIMWHGVRIAMRSADLFGSLVAIGITAAISLQVCINMGVTMGLLPTKGLPLPFISYGGTSLLINMASIGILLNIAQGKRK